MEIEKKEVDDSHPKRGNFDSKDVAIDDIFKIQELENLLKKMDEEIKVDGKVSTATKLSYHKEHNKIPDNQIEIKYHYINVFIKRVN